MADTQEIASIEGRPPKTLLVELNDRQWVYNPASTKRAISGPGVVQFTRWPDGGLDAKIMHGCRMVDLGLVQSRENDRITITV